LIEIDEKLKYELIDKQEVLEKLHTSKGGLSSGVAKIRFEQFGANVLPSAKRQLAVIRFLLQFHNILLYVLLGAAALTAVMAIVTSDGGYWIDMGVILGVVVINAIVGFIQEHKAQKALDSIKKMLALKSRVYRNGEKNDIDSENIVVGDIVYLATGDKVPADIRLIETTSLIVDESMLTGESLAVNKHSDKLIGSVILAEQKNMAFAGTIVMAGDALGVVVKTANRTELGKINQMLSETKQESTPLQKKMDKFGKILTIVILAVSVSLIPIAVWAHRLFWGDAIQAVIGIAVAAVPEGLPSVVVVILAMGVAKMAKKNAIVKRLPSVETLGSVTIICSDKTGTITKNEMTATDIFTATNSYAISGNGYKIEGEVLPNKGKSSGLSELDLLFACADICNESSICNDTSEIIGAPTEAALKVLAAKGLMGRAIEVSKIAMIPFDSEFKYAATLAILNNKKYIFMAGAPEVIKNFCSTEKYAETTKPIKNAEWDIKMTKLASEGKRMIGLAFVEVDSNKTTIKHGDIKNLSAIFLGLVGIIDPPKPDAIEAIRVAKQAGIRVCMITGDHALSAKKIAEVVGICDDAKVISGRELDEMDDKQLACIVTQCNVFARVSPAHKLKLVAAMQGLGQVVSMTGDGVNDAPALKKADIGVAMGIKGTETAKDAAQMVLADDNFATIVGAVKEGRSLYDNLKKTIIFTLPTSTAQALSIIIALLIGFTLPISSLQILWVNMVVAVTVTLSLAFELPDKDIMTRAPRKPKEPLIDKYILFRTIYSSILFAALTFMTFFMFYQVVDVGMGYDRLAHAQSVAVNMLVIGSSLFYLFNCRSMTGSIFNKKFFKNKILFIVSGILILLQIAFTYVPFMQTLFRVAPLRAVDWAFVLAGGLFCLLAIELEKFISKKVLSKRKGRLLKLVDNN